MKALIVAALVTVAAGGGSARNPHWLSADLARFVAGFAPAHVVRRPELWYSRTVAVVLEFDRVAICGSCGAPSNALLPRGRVVRIAFDRRSHRAQGGIEFCESKGRRPARAHCLGR